MITSIPARSSHLLWAALLALALIAVFLMPVQTVDLWWHMDSGRWMIEHGRYLDQEVRSYSIPDAHWPNFSWLFQVVVAAIEQVGGFWGLLVFKAFCGWLILFLLYRSCGPHIVPLAWLLATLLFSWEIFPKIYLRPHLFEGIFLAISVLLIHRPAAKHDWLGYAVLVLVWANTHASVVVGVTALAMHYVIGPDFRLPQAGTVLRRMPIALLLGLLVFATPNGTDILGVLRGHAGGEYLYVYIQEWRAPEIIPARMFVALLGIVVAVLSGRKLITPAEGLLIIVFLVLSTGSSRFLYELGILLIRPTALLVDALFTGLAQHLGPAGRRWSLGYGLASALGLAILYTPPVTLTKYRLTDYPVAQRRFPHVAVATLRPLLEAGRTLRVWAAYGWGGYLGWTGNGQLKIFIDGRTPTVFTEEMLLLEYQTSVNPRLLRQMVKQWNADVIVMHYAGHLPYPPDDQQWALVAFDSICLTYLRADLAKEYGLTPLHFNPYQPWPRIDPGQARQEADALRELLARDEDNDMAWLRLGQILGFLSADAADTPGEAEDALRRALSQDPENETTALTLALLRQKAGQDKAEVAQPLLQLLDRVDALSTHHRNELQIASLLLDTGNMRRALQVLSPDDIPSHQRLDGLFDTWLLRLVAYSRLGDADAAGMAQHMAEQLAPMAGPNAKMRLQAALRDVGKASSGIAD